VLESTFLDKIYASRESAAKRRDELNLPPLLLLYKVFARDHKKDSIVYGSYWAWSLVIPGDRTKQKKKIVIGNSVLLRDLAREEGFETLNEYLIEDINEESC
ncbi:hypothetical protein N9W65_05925, partial [Schleiferiaceae bacterium]|nr:hypothetical protein [Schleiferiaceae bacterium]